MNQNLRLVVTSLFWHLDWTRTSIVSILLQDNYDDSLVVQYKENLFTFKFLFSWFFVNGKKIFKDPDPHTKCMTPYLFPKVDCDFMKMYFFAQGIE